MPLYDVRCMIAVWQGSRGLSYKWVGGGASTKPITSNTLRDGNKYRTFNKMGKIRRTLPDGRQIG